MLAATLCGLLAGCGDGDRFDLPSAVEDVVDQNRLGQMNDLGLAVYDGFEPPDISGTYAWDDTTWVEAPRAENIDKPVCDGQITYDRNRTTSYAFDRQFTEDGCSGSGSGSGIPVSGEGSCFSFYLETTEDFSGCVSRQVQVTSGCLGSAGIEGFETGWYVAEYQSDACGDLVSSGQMPPQGEIVIQREGDRLAERQ
ncbi:MAG: hypothetical protein ACQEVA_21910 [Myxococcota bacterium]